MNNPFEFSSAHPDVREFVGLMELTFAFRDEMQQYDDWKTNGADIAEIDPTRADAIKRRLHADGMSLPQVHAVATQALHVVDSVRKEAS